MVINKVFRKYDIRGNSHNEITEEFAFRLGYSFIRYIKNGAITYATRNKDKINHQQITLEYKEINLSDCNNFSKTNLVCIAYDSRLSSEKLFFALCKGLIINGVEIISLGLVPSPLLYFADKLIQPMASIMITASHNPKQDNGFKIIVNGKSFFGEQLTALGNSLVTEITDYTIPSGQIYNLDLADNYIDTILNNIQIASELKIIWDPGHGGACEIIKKLVDKLSNNNLVINGECDGNFPNRSPDPTDTTSLIKILQQMNYDFAIALDGDADRIVIVQNNGTILGGEQLFYIFVKEILANTSHKKFIVDIKTNQTIIDYITQLGGEVIVTKTGHPFIKQQLFIENAVFAAEVSGHIYFADDYFGYDDGIYTALRFLKLVSVDLSKVVIPFFETKEIKFAVDSNKKFLVIQQITDFLVNNNIKFNNSDGIKVVNDNEWWLVRVSNTEDLIMIRYGVRIFNYYYNDNLKYLENKIILLFNKFF